LELHKLLPGLNVATLSGVECSDIRYTRSGDVAIAYQVIGGGPVDLIFVTGFVSNLAWAWEHPKIVQFYERMGAFARMVRFDRRGTGLSDRPTSVATLETRMDDVRAVMSAVGLERAAVLATFEAGPMAMLFAATYPERVGALVLFNPYAKGVRSSDYPWGRTREQWQKELADLEAGWGTREYFDRVLERSYPSAVGDESFRNWFINIMRYGASPGAALNVHRMAMDVDIRDVLPAVRVPTLIIHGPGNAGHAQFIAERMPSARRLELPNGDESIWLVDEVPEQTRRFVGDMWLEPEPETVLTTVLFTDIVRSTERAAEIGDHQWNELIGRHHALVRRQLDRFRGREIDTAGDGFFATFDGPVRAIRCARAITECVRELGLEVRAGLHTGECEIRGDKVAGIAVNIGARVMSNARPGEVLVSSTVKDLVAGSGIVFDDRGPATLKGIDGEWRLYAVKDEADVHAIAAALAAL
jgi:class 3 adenylate cyclase